MSTPRIEQVKGGFAAVGEGWAVVASTPDEAQQRYREADRLHREIQARPDPIQGDATAQPQPYAQSRNVAQG